MLGEFANKKIAELLTLLPKGNRNQEQWSATEVQYIISSIGEDLVREALQELYDRQYQDRLKRRNDLENQMAEIKRQLILLDL